MCKAAGELTFRSQSGAATHIRVLQEQDAIGATCRKVRWIFSEGVETFQVELRHHKSGLRELFVNTRPQVFATDADSCTCDFNLLSKDGEVMHRACVVVTRSAKGVDQTYQLLIDGQPIQLVSKEDDAESERRTGDTSPASSSPGSARGLIRRAASFSRRGSEAASARKALLLEMQSCFHMVSVRKADGGVGITVANSDAQLAGAGRSLGVAVLELSPDGAARKAGLCVGDLLLAVNDKPVADHREAIEAVDAAADVIALRVWGLRPTRTKTLFKGEGKIGVTISDHERGPGVLVTAVNEGEQAMRLGLRAGDVLLSINSTILKHHSMAISMIDEATDALVMHFVPGTDEERDEIKRDMEA